MRQNLYHLSIVLLTLFQCNAGEYQFVSASPRLASQDRMKLGTVAVIATSEPARYGFQKSKGKTGYAADGAGSAAQSVLEGGFGSGDGLVALGSLVVCPIAVVVGAVSGGTRKVAPDALAASEADLLRAMAEMANQSLMRDRLVTVAREQAGRVMTIHDEASVPTDMPTDYRALRIKGVDAVLETSVQDIRLRRTGSRDSSYALFIDTRVSLARAEDGVVLYDHPLQYRSGTSLFIDWTLNHAKPFKAQVETGYENLAEKIVERVLLDAAYNTPRPLDSQTLARNKTRKHLEEPPLLLAANTKSAPVGGHLVAASERLAELGTIGIISTSTFPKFSIQRPLTKGKASRELGEQFAGLGGDVETARVFAAGTFGFGVPLLAVGGVIGQAMGSIAGVPERNLAPADDALGRAVADSDMQEGLRNHVLQLANGQSGARVVLVKKPLPAGVGPDFARLSCVRCATLAWLPKGQSGQEYLVSQGVDTALEIQILNPGLKGNGGVNPSLALCTEVRASLLRVRDGRELASVPLKYQSKKYKFTEWAANDAREFREEIERCNETLAREIADELFSKSLPGIREASRVDLAGAPRLESAPRTSELETDPVH